MRSTRYHQQITPPTEDKHSPACCDKTLLTAAIRSCVFSQHNALKVTEKKVAIRRRDFENLYR
jgi:hypothetical protein